MNRSIVFRIVLALVLIGAISALGAFTYHAGLVQGLAQNVQVEAGKPLAVPYPMYPMPFGFGGFGLGGLLALLIQVFVIFAILRALLWHGPRGWRHMHGAWGNPDEAEKGNWKNNVPPFFEEWHRRSHEGQPTAAPDK